MRHPILVTLGMAAALAAAPAAASADALERSRAAYRGLRTYADTGVVVTEAKLPGGPAVIERHTFTTLFRAPRTFHFDFVKDPQVARERLVVWSDAEAFHSWWSMTGIENAYPKGTGATAFATADYPTKGAVLQIAPLLFAGSGLQGALANVVDAEEAGLEDVGGRRCRKLTGLTRDVYTATEKEVKVRRVAVWVDVETQLVRQIQEETPRGLPAGTVMRVTTTFDPQANPAIDEARFRFVPPSIQE